MNRQSERSPDSTRRENEMKHGRFLVQGHPERTWGWGTPAGRLRAERRAGLIIEGAGLRPGVRALEIGCGTGLFTTMFAATGASILAVDLSAELLERARARGIPNVTFVNKGFEDCEIDGPFDAVIGSSILHHLEIIAALTKIHSLLRPGGVISFAEPNMLNPQVALQKNVPWIKRRLGDSPDETAFVGRRLGSQLTALGFEDVAIRPFDWLHPMVPAPLIHAVLTIGKVIEATPLVRELAGSLYIRARRPRDWARRSPD